MHNDGWDLVDSKSIKDVAASSWMMNGNASPTPVVHYAALAVSPFERVSMSSFNLSKMKRMCMKSISDGPQIKNKIRVK